MANMKNYNINTRDIFMLTTDEVAVGANKNYFDIFNNLGSGNINYIFGISALPKSDVAVTGAVSARFDLYRTSSAGTGGTGFAYKSTSPNVPNIAPFDSLITLDEASLTVIAPFVARSAPTGGATISSYITRTYIFPEETNSQVTASQYFNILPISDDTPPLVLRQGEGLLIKQGSVASVSSFTFRIILAIARENGGA